MKTYAKKWTPRSPLSTTYIAAKIFVPHRKNKKDKRTNEFIEGCVDIQIHFFYELLNAGKNKARIGGIFRQAFGERDEILIDELKKTGKIEEPIEHFRGLVLG